MGEPSERARSRGREPSVEYDGPAVGAFRALLRAVGMVGRIMQPYFAGFGITGAQWGVLRTLWRAEQAREPAVRLVDLSARLLVRPPSVTGVVNGLLRAGLVRSKTSARDRRVKQVCLTASGRRLVERVLEGHQERITALLGGLGPREQERLERLLAKLTVHLEGLQEEER